MMSEKNKNYTRKCVATNQILDIQDLIRFDFDKKKNLIKLDLEKTGKGRGCYIKNDPNVWEKFYKSKGLNRSFRFNVSTEVYDSIYKQLMEGIWQKNKTE
ncbi:YlxR family protein [Mycoplasmopsis pullorum]|uniref:YlxR family protein n=1 Tax=Mycoplasmopsis pullorum TaxID=48003 RepID=UPI001F27719A|nr:YlxR family protein [Mycoplasmopsis pullorum]